MNSKTLIQLGLLTLCLGIGWGVGTSLQRQASTAITLPKPTAPSQNGSKGSTQTQTISRSASGTAGIIGVEKTLHTIPLDRFPAYFEELLAGPNEDSANAWRLLKVWGERDLEGLIAWGLTQPKSRRAGRNDHLMSIASSIIDAVSEQDPEQAWKLATHFDERISFIHWGVVSSLLQKKTMDEALAFVRKHRDALVSSSQGLGFYGKDPLKVWPVFAEFPPGKVRNNIVTDMARYYASRPMELAEAQKWFGMLPEEDQHQVAKLAKKGDRFYRIAPEHLNKLRQLWVSSKPIEDDDTE